ncbi:MAG: quinone oxidoreductase [Rhodospirillaceae bacterium]
MATVVRFHEAGGPDVLRVEQMDVGTPGPDQVRVRQTAVGVNFIDCYHRSGLYPVAGLPSGVGLAACGIIEEVGPGVSGLAAGDRVAYGNGPLGSYCSERVMSAATLLKVPANIPDDVTAGMMLRGMTVEYLTRRTFKVEPGMFVLFHAAAGGVGQIACQWLKHLGAHVIGTVGSDEKAEIARRNGCEYPVVYTRENFKDRVMEITDGKGVPVVYDGVGKTVWDDSLDCLSRRGMYVQFGNASGIAPDINPLVLSQKGSLFLTRPTLMGYTATRPELEESAGALFEMVSSGAVKIEVGQSYPLAEAAQCHRDLEARKTVGSTVLIP